MPSDPSGRRRIRCGAPDGASSAAHALGASASLPNHCDAGAQEPPVDLWVSQADREREHP
eukprot:12672346-Prorocentrum_lima.AAC.1